MLEKRAEALTDALLKTVETCRDMAGLLSEVANVMAGKKPWEAEQQQVREIIRG